jgi:hypothetical protein
MPYVDHVIVAVADLMEAGVRWSTQLGVSLTPGGRHPGGTENALAVFHEHPTYLEIICASEATSDDPWYRLVAGNVGPLTWAIGCTDIEADTERLRSLGVPVGPVRPGSRTCLDGRTVAWQTAYLGPKPTRDLPFVLQWTGSGSDRLGVGVPLRHPGGIDRIAALTVASATPARLTRLLVEGLGFEHLEDRAAMTTLSDGSVQVHIVPKADGTAGVRKIELSATTRQQQETTIDGLVVRLGGPTPMAPPQCSSSDRRVTAPT